MLRIRENQRAFRPGGRVSMFRDETTEFSGIGGRVLRQSFSVLSLINGVIIGIVLFLGSWFLMQWEEQSVVTLYSQAVLALVLARFALNGLAGEYNGTVVSTVGGPWSLAAQAAVRYLALNALWVAPLLLLGLDFGAAGEEMGDVMLGTGGGVKVTLAAAYVLGMIVAPPVFLIASVSAESFGELFTRAYWKRLFGGRLGDLYFIYVVYIGGVLTAVALTTPAVVAGFQAGADAGVTVLGLVLLFVGGLAMSLLGRLCGFFAFGEVDPAAFAPPAGFPVSASPFPVGQRRLSGASAAQAQPVNAPSGTLPAAPPPGGSPIRETAAPSTADVKPLPSAGKPVLTDAQARVEEAKRRFTQDPQGAVSMLEELRASCAPSPPVLHSLCLLYKQAGQPGLALEVACEALRLCFERGHLSPATEIFRAFFSNFTELSLSMDQILAIANNLLKTGESNLAAKTYGAVVRSDPSERRAIKGLLQIADLKLQDRAGAADAVKIYKFLLQHASSSPLAEDMQRGLDEAGRRLSRTPETVPTRD
jgi:hypothetical protein